MDTFVKKLRGDNEPYNLPTCPPDNFAQCLVNTMRDMKPNTYLPKKVDFAFQSSLRGDDVAAFEALAKKVGNCFGREPLLPCSTL